MPSKDKKIRFSKKKYEDEEDTPEQDTAAHRAALLAKADALASSIDALTASSVTRNGLSSTAVQNLNTAVGALNTTLNEVKGIMDASDNGVIFTPFRWIETVCLLVRVIKHQVNFRLR